MAGRIGRDSERAIELALVEGLKVEGLNGVQRSLLYQLGIRERNLFARVVEEVRLADELGLDAVWCLPEAGENGDFRLGTPEIELAGLASRTTNIRLGWGLAGLMPPERPPIRSAEKAASLDLASAGRLDLAFLPGTTHSAALPSADAPEATPSSPAWDEGFRMLVDMWDTPRFSWTSDRFEVLPVDVVPKPVQRPHPPLWSVGWTVEHAQRAGSAGLGFIDVSGGTDDALEMHRDRYVADRAEADPNDLVCVSAYAAVISAGRPAELAERLDAWAKLGFDQAVLRIDPSVEESLTTRGRIRIMAGAASEVH